MEWSPIGYLKCWNKVVNANLQCFLQSAAGLRTHTSVILLVIS